jgi:hypothetical protein
MLVLLIVFLEGEIQPERNYDHGAGDGQDAHETNGCFKQDVQHSESPSLKR